jgi:hypothetical protein
VCSPLRRRSFAFNFQQNNCDTLVRRFRQTAEVNVPLPNFTPPEKRFLQLPSSKTSMWVNFSFNRSIARLLSIRDGISW